MALDDYFCITYEFVMENTESIMVKKSRVGRRPLPQDEHQVLVPVRFPPALIQRLEDEIANRGDRPSKSALIREYVDTMLTAAEKKRN